MTNRKLLAVGLGAVVALGAAACNPDKLTEINQNPNNPTDAPSSTLFTNATRNAVTRWLGALDLRGFELLAQHVAEVQYPESDQYSRLRASATTASFDGAYSVELQDYQLIIDRGLAASNASLYGPAMVMRAWEFGIVTDAFGDVPYTEAFQAQTIIRPKYDTQQAIYTDLFVQLNKAATDLAASTGNSFGGADPIYNGSTAKWAKFANSVRARHAMRMSNVDPATASTQLQAAFNGPGGGTFSSNADNAVFFWPGNGVYDNPWATNFKTRDDHRISDRMLNLLAAGQDPRVSVFAMPAETDVPDDDRIVKYCPTPGQPCYVGLANALTHAQASPLVPATSRPGAIFYPGATAYGTFGAGGSSYPSYVMTFAEVAFIKAEAAERSLGGLTPAVAKTWYDAGITASMQQWGVTDAAAIAAFLARPGVAYVGGTEGLKQIARQKWIALYTDGIQAWSEVRRTCQPATVEPGPAALVDILPRRLYYSTTEKSTNADNVATAIARQGTDNFNTAVWWGKSWNDPTKTPTYEAGCSDRRS